MRDRYLCKIKLADTGKNMGGMERNCRFLEGLWERFFPQIIRYLHTKQYYFKELTGLNPRKKVFQSISTNERSVKIYMQMTFPPNIYACPKFMFVQPRRVNSLISTEKW